jgi:hypothetical protein
MIAGGVLVYGSVRCQVGQQLDDADGHEDYRLDPFGNWMLFPIATATE